MESKAAMVIQKWARGMLGRAAARRLRDRLKRDIEPLYSHFTAVARDNADYNLKKYLKDKEALREKNKTKSLMRLAESSQSIQENIEYSQSLNQRAPLKVAAPHGSHSLDQRRPQVNNFMMPPPVYDQHSIINIMLQR